MKPSGTLSYEQRGVTGWITIDNPARHNAMSLAMWLQLGAILDQINTDLRCLIIRGAGGKAFVSGADITEFASNRRSPNDVAEYDRMADGAMNRLHTLSIPTVAMISGYCIGGGLALALCCDIRLASGDSQFAIPAARLGLGYSVDALAKLLEVVSPAVARDIIFSARRFTAREALQVGLVNQVHDTSMFEDAVEAYVMQIAQNAPLTIRAAKATILALSRVTRGADLLKCADMTSACFESADYDEGNRAFKEKRPPNFLGR